MTTWVSPRYSVPPLPYDYNQWDLATKINVFYDRIDGWHLEIADRSVSGWINYKGEQAITEQVEEYDHKPIIHSIPHAAFAGLQIAIKYFETIAKYKLNKPDKTPSKKRFIFGFEDVFVEEKNNYSQDFDQIANIMWDFRCRVFHADASYGNISLQVMLTDRIKFYKNDNLLIINPHSFIPHLRQHLLDYVNDLRNGQNSQMLKEFEDTFDEERKKKYS